MHHSWRWLILVMLLLSSSSTARESFSGGQYFEYDEELAKLSLIYSSATYQRVVNWTFINPDCNKRTEGFILNESYVGDGTDAFGYVGLDTVGKRIVVAFKGTSDLRDWMTDLRTWVRYTKRCAPSALAKTSLSFSGPHLRTAAVAPGPDELIGNVHFGFCDYYQTLVAKGLADRIALLAKEFPGYNVFITGHSLGAAAAAVCAADMAQRMMIERERLVLYTLGEPRTGDGIFAEGMNDRVGTAYRIVHDKDVVPHLALCCHDWFGGKCQGHVVSCPYQHSSEIVYANDMSPGSPWVVCNDTVGEDYACDPQGWDFSVSDHKHYFGHMVGEYCRIPPEEAGPSLREEVLPEEVMWTLRDDAMRREKARFRGASMLEWRG